MRVAVGKARRLKANVRQQIAGVFAGLSGADAVDALAEGDALLHGQARIERSIAILENHLHLATVGFQRQT